MVDVTVFVIEKSSVGVAVGVGVGGGVIVVVIEVVTLLDMDSSRVSEGEVDAVCVGRGVLEGVGGGVIVRVVEGDPVTESISGDDVGVLDSVVVPTCGE